MVNATTRDLDLGFLDRLNLPDVPALPLAEDTGSGSSSTDVDKPLPVPAPPPSKGQRYRLNKKVTICSTYRGFAGGTARLSRPAILHVQAASESLQARLLELRHAIKAKEAEKEQLLLRQSQLQSGLVHSPELLAPDDFSNPAGKVQVDIALSC